MSDETQQVFCACWRCEGRPDDGTLHGTVGYTEDDPTVDHEPTTTDAP